MYHPADLAAMDPLVLMKNLDHVRMTSRRLSYILQQQVHLYTPEANQLRDQIDRYVEDRKSTRLNSSHMSISYAVFCLKKKKESKTRELRKLLTSESTVLWRLCAW